MNDAELREHLAEKHPGIGLATGPAGMYPEERPAVHDGVHRDYPDDQDHVHTETVLPKLAASAVSDDKWRTPYSTAADYATFAAALMNAGGGMEDTEAKADGDALVIEVHQVPVWRATFTCSIPGCTQCASHKFLGYTDAQLRAAWSLVPKDTADWKRPIRGFVPAGTDTDAMSAAIAHYCGSPSEFRPQPDGSIEVTASGYHACIGS